MSYEQFGNKIKLHRTISSDIEKIIDYEKANSNFVHSYSKEKHLALLNDNDCLHLSVWKLTDNKLIGHILLFGLQNQNNSLEFKRITISEKGHGYGREAVKLIMKICFDELCFHRLWLDVFDDNERAIRLYESAGFVYEGTLREIINSGNKYRSLKVYSMLADEYNKISLKP